MRKSLAKGARQVTFDQVDIARATTYSAEDADVALLLTQALRPTPRGTPARAPVS